MKQRYSYLGIVIIVLMGICICSLLSMAFKDASAMYRSVDPDVIALVHECEGDKGQAAISTSLDGTTWVECYGATKKKWSRVL